MNIENIIKFTFNIEEFISSSRYVVHKGCTDDIEKKIKAIKKIEEQFEEGEILHAVDFSHALLKFRLGIKKGDPGQFIDSSKLFRRLSYSLDLEYRANGKDGPIDPIVSSTYETKVVLLLLSSNWKDSYLLGLFSALLSAWENDNQEPVSLLRKFVIERLNYYDGGRRILNSAKQYLKFFNTLDGNLKLGTWLSLHKISVYDISSFLGFPKTWASKSYFSKVIDAYFEKIKTDTSKYEVFLSFLESHNNTVSYKRILSKMIIQLEYDKGSDIAMLVKKCAFEKIGDSNVNSKWAVPLSFTDEEKDNLLMAQEILNRWVTSQFISTFFEVCIDSYSRKRFWGEKAKYVSRIKIVGHRDTFRKLKKDDRISAFVDSRYTIASSDKDISAIMMHIGDYCIIEFSKDGYATQIFERNNSYCPSIDMRVRDSADELRDGKISKISTRNGYLADYKTKEGRLFHSEGWERVYDQFLDRHVLKK